MNKIFRLLVPGLVGLSAFGQSDVNERAAIRFLDHRAAARFLDQATWGPTPASVAQLQQMGIVEWLREQMALNTSDLPDQPLLNSAGMTNTDLTPVQAAFFQNAVTGSDQLRQRVAFALSEIW